DIDLTGLPDFFVIKLPNLAAKKGVYLLERREDTFFDHLSKKFYSEQDVIDDLGAITEFKARNIIVEEFITGRGKFGAIPYDYKIFTFEQNGTVLITQVDRNGDKDKFCFFDGDFNPISLTANDAIVRYDPKRLELGEHEVPENSPALIEAARQALAASDRP